MSQFHEDPYYSLHNDAHVGSTSTEWPWIILIFLLVFVFPLVYFVELVAATWTLPKRFRRRMRTCFWKPAECDAVYCRSLKAYGLVESIYGGHIRIEYYLKEDVEPRYLDTTRRNLLLEARPSRLLPRA